MKMQERIPQSLDAGSGGIEPADGWWKLSLRYLKNSIKGLIWHWNYEYRDFDSVVKKSCLCLYVGLNN